ncbi:hypothetical protein BAY1663_03832 [Pseudomonas sp. BAY1663]|nr:hypothetical protein BAY1663_03832 [Pseudomonas sp. BAY1663]
MARPSSRASCERSRRCAPPSAMACAPLSMRANESSWLARWMTLSVLCPASSSVLRQAEGSASRRPSSMRALRAASGVRSSWDASAMKRAWRSNWPRRRSVKPLSATTSGRSSRCTLTSGNGRRSSGARSCTASLSRPSGRSAALTASHTSSSAATAISPTRHRVSVSRLRAMRSRAPRVSATRISAMPLSAGSLTGCSRLTRRTPWPWNSPS